MNKQKIKVDPQSNVLKASNERVDGFANIYTKEGAVGIDKQTGYVVNNKTRYTETKAREIYRSNGFGALIVDKPVGAMTREWFNVSGDTDGVINKYLKHLNTKQKIKEALTWSRVFGGALVVLGIDDGITDFNALEQPVNENNIKNLEFMHVYDRYRVTWTSADLYTDPSHPKFGTPEVYTISPLQSELSQFRVHETRTLRFEGPLADQYTMQANDGWPESIYLKIESELINVSSSLNSAKNIIDDFVQVILSIENLQNMIAAGQSDLVKKRLELIDLGRHMMNTMLLDSKEQYSKEASSVAGVDKVLQEFQQALSAVTGIPMTVLMGRSPGGLNSTGDADIRNWYDELASDQEEFMYNPLSRLIYLTMLAKEGPTKGKLEEDWQVAFNPLWQPTQKEIVETKKIQSEVDNAYIQWGVLAPTEVRESRFGGEEYSFDTNIEEGNTAELGMLPNQNTTENAKDT